MAFRTIASLVILTIFFCGYFGGEAVMWAVSYTPPGVPKPVGMPRGMPDRRQMDRDVHRLMVMTTATANVGPLFAHDDGSPDWQATYQDSMRRIKDSIYDREYCRRRPERWECRTDW